MQYVNDSMSCLFDRDVAESTFTDILQRCAIRSHEAILERASASTERERWRRRSRSSWAVWPAYYLVQVGDSRYYLWREGRLTQADARPDVAKELVDQGILTRAQAPHTQFAHVLSSALGADTAEPVVTRLRAGVEQRAPALQRRADEARERRAHRRPAANDDEREAGVRAAAEDALEDGGSDNITIIVGRQIPRND